MTASNGSRRHSEEPPDPMAGARGRVRFDPKWCRTCRVCEIACSIAKEGVARPAVARIAVHFNEFGGANPITGTLCVQCPEAPCIAACPVDALVRDGRTGAVRVLEEVCIGCMRCQKACPWDAPRRHPDRRLAIKCDLCSDRVDGPQCVAMCPLAGKALTYEPLAYVSEVVSAHTSEVASVHTSEVASVHTSEVASAHTSEVASAHTPEVADECR